MIRVLEAASRVRERLSALDPTDELCCVFARCVLLEAYGERVNAVSIARWHVQDRARPWSAVEAAWDAGIAEAIAVPRPDALRPSPPVGRWSLCQGWSGLVGGVVPASGAQGHTFLWYAATAATGLRLDAAVVKPGGRVAPGAEARWTTWAELVARYSSGVALATLRPVPR